MTKHKFELPSENPWRGVEYEINEGYETLEYGYAKGLTVYRKRITWTNRIVPPTTMKLEFRRNDTNRVKKQHSMNFEFKRLSDEKYATSPEDYDETPMAVWESHWNKPNVYVPLNLIEFRIEDKLLEHTRKVIELLQVGDFVKCTGTRSGDWNKVESFTNSGIFGPKYIKPSEGHMRYTSSDNHITKVKEIVRDGVKIL